MNNFTNEYQKGIAKQANDELFNNIIVEYGEPEEIPTEIPTDEGDFIGDVGNFLTGLPMQLVGGVGDAINNAIDAARSAGETLDIPNYALQFTNESGEIDLKFLSPEEVKAAGGLSKGFLPKVGESDTEAGKMIRAITTFATGFIPAAKGLKAAGMTAGMAKSMIAGGISDAVTVAPHQVRLATLLNEVPNLRALIPDYLADNNPANEAEWEGRIKNVIEGALLGGIGEVGVKGVIKLFKGYKTAFKTAKGLYTADEVLKVVDEVPIELGPKEMFGKSEGKFYINTKRIDTEEDVKKIMQKIADASYDALSKGNKTLKGIQEASAKEYQNIHDLLGRPTTRPFTAEEARAAIEILQASSENIAALSKIINRGDPTRTNIYDFRKALAVHDVIQTKVFGGRKATSQSLNAWRIKSKTRAARQKAITDLLEGGGGTDDILKMAKLIDEVDPSAVSATAAKLTSQKWKDVHYQVWVNGLLSNPDTHAVNILSNTGTTMMAIPEKYLTAGIEMMAGSNGAAIIEANARAAGFFPGVVDGFRLMTGKTKHEALQAISKIERPADAISAAAWGKQPDSIIGKGLDYLGKAVNLPSKSLEAGDNFFKGVNYRMSLHEQASKIAYEEGLKGKAFKKRVAELVKNPTEPMQDIGVSFAQYQTFTKAGGEVTKSAQKLASVTPGGKYIVPFIRTPANILRYGFERTPLAPLMSHVRAEMKAGGSKAATATARMAGGSLLMAGVAAATLNELVTGSGPLNWKERQALERTGWQPYSIKFEDTYVSYARLEPIGSLIAYSADVTSILGQLEDEEGDSLVAASLAAFSKNLANKTFLSGMTQFIDVVNSGSEKKWERYSQKMIAGLIAPVASSAIKKGNNYFDDVKRDYTPDDTNGYLKSIFLKAAENIPGMGKSAQPLRDIWGETMTYSGGIASPLVILSPIKTRGIKDDKVNNMIADNRIIVSMPSRIIQGVQLTNKEYDKYTKLAGILARKETVDAMNLGEFDNASGGPEGEKAAIIHNILSKTRDSVWSDMKMDSPGLEDRLYNIQLNKEQKLIGGK